MRTNIATNQMRAKTHTGSLRPGIKKVAKYALGGAVSLGINAGKIIKKGGKWLGGQIEKEWRGEDENIENFRKKQRESGWTK